MNQVYVFPIMICSIWELERKARHLREEREAAEKVSRLLALSRPYRPLPLYIRCRRRSSSMWGNQCPLKVFVEALSVSRLGCPVCAGGMPRLHVGGDWASHERIRATHKGEGPAQRERHCMHMTLATLKGKV